MSARCSIPGGGDDICWQNLIEKSQLQDNIKVDRKELACWLNSTGRREGPIEQIMKLRVP